MMGIGGVAQTVVNASVSEKTASLNDQSLHFRSGNIVPAILHLSSCSENDLTKVTNMFTGWLVKN